VCALCLVAWRAWPRLDDELDRALLMVLAVVAVPLLPLPTPITSLLSPNLETLKTALSLAPPAPGPMRALSIHSWSTAWAWIVTAAAMSVFWIARARFAQGGLRRTCRMIAGLGFAVSLLGIMQAATAGRYVYWRYASELQGANPFGPFFNRNHFATWVIMALPFCLGYMAARSGKNAEPPDHVAMRTRLAHAIDPRTAWLMTAALLMSVALLLSLSRAGLLAIAVSGGVTLMLHGRSLAPQRRRGWLIGAAAVVLLGLAWADVPALRERMAGTQTGLANRFVIWRESAPVVRDFWLTGTGAGTYQEAMFVYQRSDRTVFFNQAHNHYLQVATEGGVVLLIAVGFAIVTLVRIGRARVKDDTSGMVWIRIGAACGLFAVALQSVWETGLVMPANACLAGVLAAVLVSGRDEGRGSGLGVRDSEGR
jgi:putative inorganic carbon (HCO3(-)) transporter